MHTYRESSIQLASVGLAVLAPISEPSGALQEVRCWIKPIESVQGKLVNLQAVRPVTG